VREVVLFECGRRRGKKSVFRGKRSGTGHAKLLVFVCFGQVIRHGRALIGTARAKTSGH